MFGETLMDEGPHFEQGTAFLPLSFVREHFDPDFAYDSETESIITVFDGHVLSARSGALNAAGEGLTVRREPQQRSLVGL